jgi:hypothetical protein
VREFYPVDYRDGAAAARSAASRAYPAERRAAIASVMKRQAQLGPGVGGSAHRQVRA